MTQPGEPSIPTEPNLPVDTESAYINCTIQLAAWAKREHEIDL
ncbi:MAG: Mfa1 fimbrilin C-terminal domain-containing protein [Parabacteroides sp.]|nr:Mfa1 fimbrilin C-terminal domain-containing protein [Parabacteroides sp.]